MIKQGPPIVVVSCIRGNRSMPNMIHFLVDINTFWETTLGYNIGTNEQAEPIDSAASLWHLRLGV